MATTESATEIADYDNDREASPAQKVDDDLAAMKKRVAAIEAEAAKISSMTTLSNEGSPSSTKAASTEATPNETDTVSKGDDVKAPKDGAEENWPSTIEEQQELDQRSVHVKNVCHYILALPPYTVEHSETERNTAHLNSAYFVTKSVSRIFTDILSHFLFS